MATRCLAVHLHERLTGHLWQERGGHIRFAYAEDWLSAPAAQALSRSLPLRAEPFTQRECAGYFGGLLPEAGARTRVARVLGISAGNEFALLAAIGGDCAGAVTFVSDGQALPAPAECRALSSSELAALHEHLAARPLLAGTPGVRQTLAGAQDKLAVTLHEGTLAVPLEGTPSTHILKPAHSWFEGLAANERLCLTLARAVGLCAVKAEAAGAGEGGFLLTARYDRRITASQEGRAQVALLHQEDICQALGIPSHRKYQSDGGPSLARCFALIGQVSSDPDADRRALLDAALFNALIGNADAHGKNFSLIYPAPGVVRLAPLYDLVCTAVYPEISPKAAMKVGGEGDLRRIGAWEFEKLAGEAGLPWGQVRARVAELAARMLEAIPDMIAAALEAQAAAVLIEGRCRKVMDTLSRRG